MNSQEEYNSPRRFLSKERKQMDRDSVFDILDDLHLFFCFEFPLIITIVSACTLLISCSSSSSSSMKSTHTAHIRSLLSPPPHPPPIKLLQLVCLFRRKKKKCALMESSTLCQCLCVSFAFIQSIGSAAKRQNKTESGERERKRLTNSSSCRIKRWHRH